MTAVTFGTAAEPKRCPVCWSTRCLASQEYAPGKKYGHRWSDGPMSAAHARWRDENTPPAGPDELPGVTTLSQPEDVTLLSEPIAEDVTHDPVSVTGEADVTLLSEEFHHTCSECGNPFTSRRPDAKLCSPACRKRASRRSAETTP
jgi:hypothetical protein